LLEVGINAAPLAARRTGVGRYIAGLLQALAKAPLDGVRARPLFMPGAPARKLRGLLKRLPFAYPLAEAARAAVLLRERPTVYHETNHAAPPFRGPVVVTIHDLSTVLHPETQDPARARYFARKLRSARRAQRVIVPTDAIRREVMERLGVAKDRVRVIHHGVDPLFQPGNAPRGGFVLYTGDDGPRKGLTTLRGALPDGVELRLAGPGHGYLPDEQLLELYRTAAVLVLPSLYEGFGFPLLEAMACGTPCIASDDPALMEVSGGAALHFPRGDAAGLRTLLQRVLREPALREELSRKGLERARAFSWARSAGEHVEVYREAAR
jgi:alpha-1,3-rhamnosyl/mannosyltransferase